jgi:hypothetical protein
MKKLHNSVSNNRILSSKNSTTTMAQRQKHMHGFSEKGGQKPEATIHTFILLFGLTIKSKGKFPIKFFRRNYYLLDGSPLNEVRTCLRQV